jgi:hypothetical protein
VAPAKQAIFIMFLVSAANHCGLCCQGDEALPSDPGKARVLAAQRAYERWERRTFSGLGSLWGVHAWSRRWMDGEVYLKNVQQERRLAAEGHLGRMNNLHRYIQQEIAAGHLGVESYLGADFYLAEARFFFSENDAGAQAKSAQSDAGLARRAAARLRYGEWWKEDEQARLRGNGVHVAFGWSRDWLEADMAMLTKEADRVGATDEYLIRTKELEKFVGDAFKRNEVEQLDIDAAKFYRADAEYRVVEAKTRSGGMRRLMEVGKSRLRAATLLGEASLEAFRQGRLTLEAVCNWSIEWRNAAIAIATTKPERIALAEAHLQRIKEVESATKQRLAAGLESRWIRWGTAYFVADGEIFLAEVKSK